jgi:hypothetical protein
MATSAWREDVGEDEGRRGDDGESTQVDAAAGENMVECGVSG